MRYILWALLIVGPVLLLGGCAAVSREQCQAGDWTALGETDGATGHPSDRLSKIAEDCGRYSITPDSSAYMAGWHKGVQTYCTPENGFSLGRQGRKASAICPPALNADFEPAYDLGHRLWAAEDRIGEIEADIRRLEREISNGEFRLMTVNCHHAKDHGHREECRDDVRDAHFDLQSARFDLMNLHMELYQAQQDYEATKAEVNAAAPAHIPGFTPL